MTGKDFLTFAKIIYNHEDEAARRSAVSRAYYALFHLVKSIVVSAGIYVSNEPGEHDRLVRYLKQSGIDEAKKAGREVGLLRGKRNEADYNLINAEFNKITSAFYYNKAEVWYKKLDEINNAKLKKGLITYAKLINEL
jgi:uncharacterized protein (UPF0332 family)